VEHYLVLIFTFSLCHNVVWRGDDYLDKNKKERKHHIQHKLEDRPVRAVRLVLRNDEFYLEDEKAQRIKTIQTNVIGTRERENDKGDKVLFNLTDVGEGYLGDINQIFLQYDLIYAIDTNYKEINGTIYSVTAITRAIKTGEDIFDGQLTNFSFVWNDKYPEKIENWAWVGTIENIRNVDNLYYPGRKVILVVDSDLDKIEQFNNKEIPIFEDYFLPEGFILYYASADSGSEYMPNKMIQMCDKHAKDELKEIEKEIKS